MESELMTTLWQQLWHGLRYDTTPLPPLQVSGDAALTAAFPVSELAATSIALAAQAAASLTGNPQPPRIDGILASRWFHQALRPIGHALPSLWDAFAGDYATADGWIRLHTNAPHHREAMEQVLGRHRDRQQLAETLQRHNAIALEEEVVAAGGCAAALRSEAAWLAHPHGHTVGREALIEQNLQPAGPPPRWPLPPARPLHGVRVLDLTRIIAGPVASRFLAGLGADVLRLDPPDWQEPVLEQEVTLGKRCARLDLKCADGRRQFELLLSQSDVLIHGYRADALSRLGYDEERLQELSPGLIDVSLNAWGWSGPWRNRRGFDSLVQMACGLADAGRQRFGGDAPVPLPVQALDHATGYLMAATVLEGMRQRVLHHNGFSARLSLARTACLLQEHPYLPTVQPGGLPPQSAADEEQELALTGWGLAARLRSPFWLPGTPLLWSRAPSALGSALPRWQSLHLAGRHSGDYAG